MAESAVAPAAKPRGRRRAAEPADSAPAESSTAVDSADDELVSVDEAAIVAAPRRRTGVRTLVLLGVVIVVFGAFAVFAAIRGSSLRDNSGNTALTDVATTSQVVGQVTNAVNTAFSYNYTNLNKTQQAVQKLLTGQAIGQYNTLFKTVEQQAPAQKLIVTVTVQIVGVQSLQGDHAHVLVFANEASTRVATNQQDQAGAMFSVDAVRQSGQWKISNIDIFS